MALTKRSKFMEGCVIFRLSIAGLTRARNQSGSALPGCPFVIIVLDRNYSHSRAVPTRVGVNPKRT